MKEPVSPQVTISLCIVAKDEAAFIAAAIESARPVVDEVVVVDTGSGDATPQVARDAGARVIEAPWPGDMCRAHDLPVSHARGDWALILDADEVLDPGSRAAVRSLVSDKRYEGYTVEMRNYTYGRHAKWRPADALARLSRGASTYGPTFPVRLFRRRPHYHHRGRLHDSVGPSIRAAGGRIGQSDVIVHHYGLLRFDRDKTEPYLRRQLLDVAETPEEPATWINLGLLLDSVGNLPAAVDAFRRAWSLGDRQDGAYFLGSALLDMGLPGHATRFLHEAIRTNARDAALLYDRADAWEALGSACEREGRLQAAQQAYRAALRIRPDSPPAMHNLAAMLSDAGAGAEAARLCGDLVARHPGFDSAWNTLGVVRLRNGDLAGARRAFETALDARPENLAARMNLALTHRRAGHPRRAAQAYAVVGQALGSPEARALGLEERLPSRYRPRPWRRPSQWGSDVVVNLIWALAAGGGRVLVDTVMALRGRPQLVVCGEPCFTGRQGLRAELAAAGVDVLTVRSETMLRLLLQQVRPAVVIHHWGRQPLRGAIRTGAERWVCIGHAPLPMPLGYDAYVAGSRFHENFQTHLPPDRVRRIPNGVDLTRFAGQRHDGAGRPPEVTIAMVSRLDDGKFPPRLLAYLPRLDRARVLVAGWGPRRYEINRDVARLGLGGSVRLVGPIPAARVPDFLQAADIGLHLTDTHEEVCSLAILEMLAAGLPIVAEPKGCLPEMVVPGVNGFLETSEADVAQRLGDLIASGDLRERLGEESRHLARRFDMATFRSSIRALIEEVETRMPVDGGGRRTGGARVAAGTPTPRRRPGGRSFLVCATPRAGASLLCEALANTGLAGSPERYFSDPVMRTLAGRWGTPRWDAYTATLQEATSSPNGVFGALVTNEDLTRLLDGMRAAGGEPLAPGALLEATFPGLRYVWIRRRDTLCQAVSWERAAQTGVWCDTGNPVPVAVPRPRFDRAAIARRQHAIEEGEAAWCGFLGAAGARAVHVDYEDLAGDYKGTARRVLEELGIPLPEDLWFGPRRLRRQSDARTDRWVERFTGDTSRRARGRVEGPTGRGSRSGQ